MTLLGSSRQEHLLSMVGIDLQDFFFARKINKNTVPMLHGI